MAAKRCPKCKLINPATAARCDCGWSFIDGRMTDLPRRPPASEDEVRRARQAAGHRDLVIGSASLLFGGFMTAVTYVVASTRGGGSYVIAYGAIIVGIVEIIRGVMTLQESGRDR